MTASGGVYVRREADGIAEVVLDRPEAMNALSTATLDQLATDFTAVAADPSVRVVVLSAAGERAFCVGADLKERAAMSDASAPCARRGLKSTRRLPPATAKHRAALVATIDANPIWFSTSVSSSWPSISGARISRIGSFAK